MLSMDGLQEAMADSVDDRVDMGGRRDFPRPTGRDLLEQKPHILSFRFRRLKIAGKNNSTKYTVS